MSTPVPPLVIGLGRPLGGDDQVGLAVADHLLSKGIPAIRATDTASLIPHLESHPDILLIDAVVGRGAPGDIVLLTEDDLRAPEAMVPVSSHMLTVAAALGIARSLGATGRLRILGITIRPPDGRTLEMTPEVRASIDPAATKAMALLLSP
ncbi:MAG: hydrogenase maturation protease [Polyangiaceae bacterium]